MALTINSTLLEMWIEYGIGIVILILRMFARHKYFGWRWDGDDYMAAAAVVLFTLEVAMCQIISTKGSITGMTEEVALSLTPGEIDNIVIGAKWLFAAWYIYVSLIWSLKGIMLFFFSRLTKTLPEERLVKAVSVVTVAAYIATIGVVSGHCRPVSKQWQIYPLPGDDCSQNISKYLALVTTNVSTDLMIMYIPIPLLWKLQVSVTKKFMFGLLFCAGGFIMICTILRCVICLQQPGELALGLSWSIRETVVGIAATNAPAIKPLFAGPTKANGSSGQSSDIPGLITIGGTGSASHQLSRMKNRQSRHQKIPEESTNESQEHIYKSGDRTQNEIVSHNGAGDVEAYPGSIQVTKTYAVEGNLP